MGKSKVLMTAVLLITVLGCNEGEPQPTSSSGVQKVTAEVNVDPTTGMTLEQRNISDRYDMEGVPGAIKHLYIISPYTGDVLLYSTVRGKVTSSGKRLTPYTVAAQTSHAGDPHRGIAVRIGDKAYYTPEVLQDDGTYGQSISYLYWWDTRGVYHKHYIGTSDVHISDQPMAFPKIILNLEVSAQTQHSETVEDSGRLK